MMKGNLYLKMLRSVLEMILFFSLKPNHVQVLVKTLTGRRIPFQVQLTDTIQSFQLQIRDRIGIAVNSQRLLFSGKQLEDGRTLSDYNIKKDSLIMMVVRLLGGENKST